MATVLSLKSWYQNSNKHDSFKKTSCIPNCFGANLATTAQVKLPALVGDNTGFAAKRQSQFMGMGIAKRKNKHSTGMADRLPCKSRPIPDGTWKTTVNTPRAAKKNTISPLKQPIKSIFKRYSLAKYGFVPSIQYVFSGGKEEKTWKTGVVNYEEEIKNANYPNIPIFTVFDQSITKTTG